MSVLPARIVRVAACLVWVAAAPAFAQEQKAPIVPTISVMGTGEAELKPDFARIFVIGRNPGRYGGAGRLRQ